MDSLYRKLYTKYSNLKKEKDSQFEKLTADQEVKFLKYVEAAEEMIDYLRSENERLSEQVNKLRNEVNSSTRATDEQLILYQKLLMEENQKNQTLSEEIDRLRNLQQEGPSYHISDKVDSEQLSTPGGSQVEPEASNSLASKLTRKRRRNSIQHGDDMNPCQAEDLEKSTEDGSAIGLKSITHDLTPNISQPKCCKTKVNTSGGEEKTGPYYCIFQDLIESVIGMKLSTVAQNEESCVTALHKSSGYSFSLTWINNSHGEVELLYRVTSLGTFERLAPEWMREVLIFSSSMCPVFFERVSRVIKLSH